MNAILYPDPILSAVSPQKAWDEVSEQAAIACCETLIEYGERAAAVAAPQVGFSERLFASWDLDGHPQVIFNPIVLRASEDPWHFKEGCLSLPGIFLSIQRPREITIDYLDIDGKGHELTASDFEGRVIQHEIDHLDGIMMFERLPKSLRKQFDRKTLPRLEGT